MKYFHRIIAIPMLLLLLACAGENRKAKNIIVMVPDGMGISNVTAARIFKNGPDGGPLALETLSEIGYQRTQAKDSTVTDSAAAASAWACGEKFNNNEVCCHDNDRNGICDDGGLPETILEMAKRKGKGTGLVATSTITHATPAVWASHVHHRNCETEIARQYIDVTGVDILLGGGFGSNRIVFEEDGSVKTDEFNCSRYAGQDKDEIMASAQSQGYAYVNTKSEMYTAVSLKHSKILGLFAQEGKTPETFRVDPSLYPWPQEEPTLSEMTIAALDVLEENKKGFFLMIEGSQIDWANHANANTFPINPSDPAAIHTQALKQQIGETLAFDDAVKAVLNWMDQNPSRGNETLLIIVPDHDCGGFAINGPKGKLSRAGELVEDGWTSNEHTAEDTVVWSQGPNSQKLGKAIDNTVIFSVMKEALGLR
jgi:alkaline phosphatase